MNSIFRIVIFLWLFTIHAAVAEPLPVLDNGQYGYYALNGDVVIKPQYERASRFSEELAAVMRGGKWGFIRTNGETVIEYQFEDVQSFSEGLAGAKMEGKWGFIDMQGKFRISPQFSNVRHFAEGYGGAMRADKRWMFILANGTQAISGTFDAIGDFSGGLAPISIDGNWAFIDKVGQQAIASKFAAALSFSDNLAAVEDRETGKYGYIRRDGSFHIKPQFTAARSFSEQLAAVQVGTNRWGYITNDGELTIRPRFYAADSFKNGVAEVSDPVFGRSLYINRQSHVVLVKSSEPELGKFAGTYTWITNIIDSVPANASVFAIPQPDWKGMPPEERTNAMYQATGRTRLEMRINLMPYIVLGILPDGRQTTAPLNPITAVTNYLLLQDFK